MRTPSSVIRLILLVSLFGFASPMFFAASAVKAGNASPSNSGIADATPSFASSGAGMLNSFGVRIAGTYLVTRQPADGPSRILNIFADGNLTSIQSTQFGGGALGENWFSNQNGTWQRIGTHEIKATVLDLSYSSATGEFLGIVIAYYHMQFDSKYQAVAGSVEGKIFSPGVDPVNPGNTQPIAEFTDTFQAQRIPVGN